MFAHQIAPDLSLEMLDLRHASELFSAVEANREHLRRWLPWLDLNRSLDDTRAFIARSQRQSSDNRGFQSVIRWRGRLVGIVGHHSLDWSNRAMALGYWLAKDAQGHGIMTTACQAYLDHAFRELALHRAEIRCAVGNTRSRAIPERLGFRSEGTIRSAEWLYDHFVDHVIYGQLADEWRTRTRADGQS